MENNHLLTEKQIEFLIRALVLNYAETSNDFKPNDIVSSGPASLLIGKMAQFMPDSGDEKYELCDKIYYAAEDSRYLKQKINKRLSMGAGNISTVALNNLHKRLNFAACQLAGREQNGGMGHEFDEKRDAEEKQDIIDVVKDIMIAFDLKIDDLGDKICVLPG